jgi:hypothetical protein
MVMNEAPEVDPIVAFMANDEAMVTRAEPAATDAPIR